MKVLVLGYRGMLGGALTAALDAAAYEWRGADLPELDIRDRDAVMTRIAAENADAVVNCAAFTRVDDCEAEEELCHAVNAGGAGNVAAAAAAAGARLIHISTDYVFDGKAYAPYSEEATPAPLSAYGRSKLAGEEAVKAAADDYLIIRGAWLFGVGGENFVSKILARADRGEALAVVDDQRGSPTYSRYLARAIVNLLAVEYRGIVHFAANGVASWYQVAREVLALAGADALLKPFKTATLAGPARRPAFSALDWSRYRRLTGEVPPRWREGLAAYLAELGRLVHAR